MNNKFDELTKGLAQSVTRCGALKKFGISLAGMALACFGLAEMALAQSSVVCDPAGDAFFSNGKGSAVPPWLDIIQGNVTAGSDDTILFTLTVNAPIPAVPSWKGVDDGGQLTWGWRLIGNLADVTFVSNGCLGANGSTLPGAYYLDLFWSVQTSSFEARLVDNTSCTQVAVPFALSPDRTQVIMVVAKSWLANPTLIPNPDSFQYSATTVVWKSNSTGNRSWTHLDWAPNLTSGGGIVAGTWSSSTYTTYGCQ
jgi:hypothetical protein